MESLANATSENCTRSFCLPQDVPVKAKPLRIVDGDTIECAIVVPDELFGGGLMRIKVRVSGIDTPELRSKNHLEVQAAAAAATATSRFLEEGILVSLIPVVCCKKTGKTEDSFGRLVANVVRDVDGRCLATYLLESGFARVFSMTNPPPKQWDEKLLLAMIANINNAV